MRIENVYPSRYLNAASLESEIDLTFKSITLEEMPDGKKKLVAFFNEIDKALVINKTNLVTIGQLHGSETDFWLGKKVTIFVTEVPTPSGMKPGIRVRSEVPNPLEVSSLDDDNLL